MANFERGSDDVRVFDAAEDEEDVEGSRLPLLIVIALLVLAAFGAVVWLAYQRGVQQGHAEAPRVIAAEQGPAKVAPDSAGGTPTPYTGLKIYQQPAPSDAEASNDTAPSNDAMKPPATPPAQATPAPAPPKPQAAAAVSTPPPSLKPAVTAPTPEVVKPPPPKPAPTQTVAATPPPKPAPAPVVPAVETPAPTSAPAGGGLLQIGAYKSEAEANAAWTTYKHKHASLLSALSSDVKQVDLGAKGTWYRLRIVSGSKSEASALCAKLKAEGGDCLLAK